MALNLSFFNTSNIADTCAVWNVLSSKVLYQTALSTGCIFSCTSFVTYECLFKPRKKICKEDQELQMYLRKEQQNGRFKTYNLELEDLLEVNILEKRKKLGRGELSSIAFALRTNQAFMTDDLPAIKFANEVMDRKLVQTTPHLFGWLFYKQLLGDSDKDFVIAEHESLNRPLKNNFEEVYQEALRYRLIAAGEQIPTQKRDG